jgi:hypothetical protein
MKLSVSELREIVAAATPGPWRYRDRLDNGLPWSDVTYQDGDDWGIITGDHLTPEDAAFIIACREALPSILDRLEAAEAFVEAFRRADLHCDLIGYLSGDYLAPHENVDGYGIALADELRNLLSKKG